MFTREKLFVLLRNEYPECPDDVHRIVCKFFLSESQISTGFCHSIILKPDGFLIACGYEIDEQVSSAPTGEGS